MDYLKVKVKVKLVNTRHPITITWSPSVVMNADVVAAASVVVAAVVITGRCVVVVAAVVVVVVGLVVVCSIMNIDHPLSGQPLTVMGSGSSRIWWLGASGMATCEVEGASFT